MNVSSLAESQWELTSDSKAKAEMLNDFFSSVFTKELETDMPVLDNLCDAKLVAVAAPAFLSGEAKRDAKKFLGGGASLYGCQ